MLAVLSVCLTDVWSNCFISSLRTALVIVTIWQVSYII